MELHFKKGFIKSYQKLSRQDQRRIDQAISEFQKDPDLPHLRNHPLKGKLQGKRAFSAGFDLRIIYQEEGAHTVVFLLKTGSHNQVY